KTSAGGLEPLLPPAKAELPPITVMSFTVPSAFTIAFNCTVPPMPLFFSSSGYCTSAFFKTLRVLSCVRPIGTQEKIRRRQQDSFKYSAGRRLFIERPLLLSLDWLWLGARSFIGRLGCSPPAIPINAIGVVSIQASVRSGMA